MSSAPPTTEMYLISDLASVKYSKWHRPTGHRMVNC